MKKILLPIAAITGTTAILNSALASDYETEPRDLGGFNKIVLNGSADVNIVVGETQSVEVRTESDYVSRVKTEVKGKTLYISQEGRRWRNVDVTLEVSVENLNGIIIDGSGDFDVTNLDSESFELAINGSGDVNLSGNSGSFNVEIDGSGDVSLSGGCDSGYRLNYLVSRHFAPRWKKRCGWHVIFTGSWKIHLGGRWVPIRNCQW